MPTRKRELIEANLAKLKSMTVGELRIAAAGPGEFANDARQEIDKRVAEAGKSAATKQTSASWAAALAAIALVAIRLLLGLILH